MADRFPATFLQEWYADAHDSGWSDLSVSVPVGLPAGCGEAVVRQALADLAARHEAFRTTLVRTAAGVEQEVAATATVPLTTHADAPFQVCGGPLARAALTPGGVLLVAHHAICDGSSAGVAHRDLTELCLARHEGRAPMLPDLDLQFADYAVWEHAARQRPVPPYWRDRLRGLTRLRLADPAALHRPARLESVPLPVLPPGALAGSPGTTTSRVLGALAVAALQPFAGERVTVGLITSNRHRPELRHVVGDLWDQVPVTVDVSDDPVFDRLVVRYDEAVSAAQDHHVPLAVLAPLLGPGPLFDVRVNHFPDAVPDGGPPRRTDVVDRWWHGLSLLDFQFRTRPDGGVDGNLLVNVEAVPADRVELIRERFGQVALAPVGGRR